MIMDIYIYIYIYCARSTNNIYMLQNSYIYQFGSFFDLSGYCLLILNYSRVGSCNSSQLVGVSSENCL